MEDINQLIREILPTLIELRHSIHSYPELGFEEFETAKKVLNHLEKLPGLDIKTEVATTGIVATLCKEKKGPCVALRADMDALPIQEENDFSYKSTRDGLMHACGHDGHTTCLVGAAMVLATIQDQLEGPVKFIFQPAEEGGGGGRLMCEQGALENPKVDAIFALHGKPDSDTGVIKFRNGPSMASADAWDLTIKGRGGHAAYPQKTIDPILISSQIIVALQSIVARNVAPVDSGVIAVGHVNAGTAGNIVPDTAHMKGTIRALKPEVRKLLIERFTEVVTKTAEMHGATVEINWHDGYPPVVNDERAYTFIKNISSQIFPAENISDNCSPSLGGEDFAYYGEHVPACFWWLGIKPRDRETYPWLHQPKFDFRDEPIETAVRLHVEVARKFAAQW